MVSLGCQLTKGALPAGAESGVATDVIDTAVVRYALPLSPVLLEDDDPMPLYALKMLGVLLPVNPHWVATIHQLGIAKR